MNPPQDKPGNDADRIAELLANDDDSPKKSFEELWREGTITARQYRSFLFLLQTGVPLYQNPEDVILGIDRKIAELTAVIEQEEGGRKS